MSCLRQTEEDAVLDAAFSLIDDVYSVHGSADEAATDGSPPQPSATVRRLRGQVASLEGALVEAEQAWRDGEMARAWAQVAKSQRAQSKLAIEENAALKESVSKHFVSSRRMARLLEHSSQLMRASREWEREIEPRFRPGHDKAFLESVLRERLEATPFTTDPRWACPRPPLGPPFWDRSSHCDGSKLEVCNKYSAYFPFKLSVVAHVLWEYVNHRNIQNRIDHDLSQQFEASRQVTYLVHESYGRYETHGHGVFRREFQSDGSVFFSWASIAAPNLNDTDCETNLLAGLKLYEVGWMRATRLQSAGPDPLTYIEEVAWKHVHPTDPDADKSDQLKRLEGFMQRLSEQYNLAGWQSLGISSN